MDDSSVDLTTVLGRSVERGLALTPSQLNSAGRRAVAIFRLVEGQDPAKAPEIIRRRYKQSHEFQVMVYGYPRTHVPMCIDRAIDSVLNGEPPPVKSKRMWHRGPMMRNPLAERPAAPPRVVKPPTRREVRTEGQYLVSSAACWSCQDEMPVYTWDGHRPWGADVPPPTPVPSTVKLAHSRTIGREYWANVCPSCESLLGDFYLHLTPAGPFYGLKSNAVLTAIVRQLELCADEGLPMFAPENGVCWSCKGQIYERADGSKHVTDCPLCGRSFCD